MRELPLTDCVEGGGRGGGGAMDSTVVVVALESLLKWSDSCHCLRRKLPLLILVFLWGAHPRAPGSFTAEQAMSRLVAVSPCR